MSNRTLAVLALCLPLASCGGEEVGSTEGVRPEEPPLSVTTVVAESEEVPDTLELTGTLAADEESRVTPLVAGRVSEVLVERGATVSEGDPLVRLRATDYRLASESASAALEQARARLGIEEGGEQGFRPEALPEVRAAEANRQLAEDALARTERLAGTGAVSAADLEGARQRAAAAREQHASTLNAARGSWFALKNARVALEQARRNLADSSVAAPFAGQVAERHVSVGEFVAPQQPVVTLVRVDPLRLELQVPQERMALVREGQRVEILVDAYPDRVFEGTVRYVGAAIRADSRSLTVEAVVPNEDRALRPGIFATARVVLGGRRERVTVPARAVRRDAGTHRVFTVVDGEAREHVVSIARTDGERVWLADGLEAGSVVVLDHLDRLADGVAVAATAAEEP